MSDAFPYLSVLVSIIIGLGMSHLLGALVRGIHNRTRRRFYWPSLVWDFNLFVLLMLVWWSEFDLNHHEHWTFAIFACTIALPALIYVMCGLIPRHPKPEQATIYGRSITRTGHGFFRCTPPR